MHMKKSTLNFKMLTLAAALFTLSAGVTGQTVIFSENFDKFSKGSPNKDADNNDVSGSLDTYTESPGWKGSKVYQAGGTIKIGGSKNALGWIETPAIDLSGNGGEFTLEFKSMAWSGDPKEMKIYLNGVLTHTVTDLPNTESYILQNYSIPLTGGTSATTIKFEGIQASKGRFFLEDLRVIANASDAPSITSPSSFTYARIDKNASTTENITIKGANLTGDLSVEVSGAPFSSTVTTITQAEALAGYDIPVTFAPTSRGIFTGQLIINGGGLAEPKTIALKGEAHGDLTPSDLDVSAPVASISFDFEDITNNVDFEAEGWSNINVKNDRKWQGKTFTKDGITDRYVQATAYSSSNQSDEEFDIWLVTPAIDFGALAAGTKLTFDQAVFGAEPNTTFGVYHIAMNGNTVVKTKLTIDKEATVNNEWINTEADISGLSGVGFIAFNYNRVAGVTTAANYRVDNVKLGVSTAVKNPSAETVSVYVKEGTIVVDVKVPGGMIEVFNIAGQRVASQPAMEGSNTISLPQGQIYIVKAGSFVQKVAL